MKMSMVLALAAIISMPFLVISYDVASARMTCSEARSICGKQRVCRERFQWADCRSSLAPFVTMLPEPILIGRIRSSDV